MDFSRKYVNYSRIMPKRGSWKCAFMILTSVRTRRPRCAQSDLAAHTPTSLRKLRKAKHPRCPCSGLAAHAALTSLRMLQPHCARSDLVAHTPTSVRIL